jgi:hypothetical protein
VSAVVVFDASRVREDHAAAAIGLGPAAPTTAADRTARDRRARCAPSRDFGKDRDQRPGSVGM